MIEIPEDAYPKSGSTSVSFTGLPDYAKGSAKDLVSRLPGLMDTFTGSIKKLEDDGDVMVDDWLGSSNDAYTTGLNQVGNWLQAPMNDLASRGLWDSTLARDAIVNLGGSLADDYKSFFSDAAAKGNEMKLNLAESIPAMWGTAFQGGLGALDASKETMSFSESFSEDPLARYTEMLSLLL